jgi:glycosyltransferase involved in cell wall biosynthesis
MAKIIVYTCAYNAEKTLRRTVDSVLSQTHGNFVYYLIDNGSTDSTGEIIRSYSEADGRVKALANKINHTWSPEQGGCGAWLSFLDDYGDDCYFCVLDADDEYLPDFLEKTMSFIERHNLDLAACGNYFMEAATGAATGIRAVKQDMILEGASFAKLLPDYYGILRSMWDKLYSLPTVRGWFSVACAAGISYGIDNLYGMDSFRRAKRAGIMAEPLHKYYVNSGASLSVHFDESRMASDRMVFNAGKDYLMAKAGEVTPQNEHFLYSVYLDALQHTFNTVVNAKISMFAKQRHVEQIKAELAYVQNYLNNAPPEPASWEKND